MATTKTTSKRAESMHCNVQGCTKKPTIRGLCDGHYQSRRGDADPKPSKADSKTQKG